MKHTFSKRVLSFILSFVMLLSQTAMPVSAGAPPVVAEDTTIYYDNSASLWEKVYVNWANPQTNANEVKEVFDTDGDGLYEALIYGQTPSASFGPGTDLTQHPLWLGMGGEAIVAGKTYRYVPETTGEEDPTTPSGPVVAEDTTIYYDNSASGWAQVFVNWANPQTNANEVKEIFDTDGDGLYEALIYGQTPSASFGPGTDLTQHPLWLGMGGEAIVAGKTYRYVPEGSEEEPADKEDTTIYYDNTASLWDAVYVSWMDPETNETVVKQIQDPDGDGIFETKVYSGGTMLSFGPSSDQSVVTFSSVTAGRTYKYTPPTVAEDTTIYYSNASSRWERVYVNWANPQTGANVVKEVFDTDGDGLYEATIYGRTPSASFGPSADVTEHLLWLGMGGEAIVAGNTYRYVPETTSEDVTIVIPEDLPDQETAEELAQNGAVADQEIDAPEGVTLEIQIQEISTEEETLVLTFDVTPRDAEGEKAELEEAITFRLPVPASVTEGYAKIYHYDELIDVAPILQEYGAKFVEITSKDFSPYSVKPTGHDYVAVVTPPTCEEEGYTTYTCSECGDSFTDNYVSWLSHDYGDWIVDEAPTCTESGTHHKECGRCGDIVSAWMSPLGHSEEVVCKDPTETGHDEYCARCDTLMTASVPHSYDAATHSCACGKQCGHAGNMNVDSGICTESFVCSECQAELRAAGDHDFVDGVCSVCSAEDLLGSGDSGKGVKWKLLADGTLIIYGSGSMEEVYSGTYAPWYDLRDQVLRAVIEPGITIIGGYAFYGCTEMSEIEIADGVTIIGGMAFRDCSSLTQIQIPGSVRRIDVGTFSGCTGLTEIDIPEGVTKIAQGTFMSCTGLTKVTIPGSVTSIEESAFQSCTGLTEIVLPESVTSIGKDAFWNCSGLTDITLPEGLVSIGPEAFAYCTSLTDITLPGSVRRIGSGAFARCEALTGIALPEGITAIEVYTFQRCEALTEVVLPESLTSIGEYAFSGCTGLTEIVIPGGVASIEENSFYLCSDLTDVYYGATAEDWAALGDHRFADYIHYSCTDREGHWYQESAQPTCTEAGYDREACACGYIRNEQTTPATGHSHTPTVTAPTCTEPGFTTYTCSACGDSYEADDVAPLGHDMGPWTPIDEELEQRECSRCDYEQTRRIGGNILVLTDEELMAQDTLWVDGQPVPVQGEGDERYVELPTGAETTLVAYSWHIGDGADVHTQYPTGMKVYRIEGDELGYTAEYIPELDDLLRYSGSSIRITGNKGIRMITAITQANKNALTGEGLAGYTLEEYGTALCWATDLAPGEDLVLGKAYTRSNYAYKKDVADPVFAYSGDVMKYTNVLVGFDNEQCAPDIAMRPYIILSDAEGDLVTLYGGTVYRSIGYIAWQNRLDFSPGTASYAFIWDIIHHVYGDIYDADYQG